MTGAMLAGGDLRLLLAEITTARTLLGQLAAEVESVRQRHPAAVPREALALIAVDLHSYYTKLEGLLERVLISFEGQAPRGESGHAGLLRVGLAIPGVRPAIFFRHAYALDLRADKLARVLDPFITGHPMIDGELQTFATFIERTVDQLEARHQALA